METMMRGDRISSVFWLIFSTAMAVQAYHLGLGNLHSPQAGFLPFAASLILGSLSLMLLLSDRIRKQKSVEKAKDVTFNKQTLIKVFCVIGGLFFYGIFLNALGFVLITMIFIGFMLGAVAPQKWYVFAIGTISIPILAYLLFGVGLRVQLPKGFLGF
jgi:putative tricarboxylic transport membrane protein